jgi:hypothetical protein
MEYTRVSTPTATLAPSRRCDCGVISTHRLLLRSHRVRCPRGDCRRCWTVCVLCVDGLTPLLGCRPIRVRVSPESIYLYPSLYRAVHSLRVPTIEHMYDLVWLGLAYGSHLCALECPKLQCLAIHYTKNIHFLRFF